MNFIHISTLAIDSVQRRFLCIFITLGDNVSPPGRIQIFRVFATKIIECSPQLQNVRAHRINCRLLILPFTITRNSRIVDGPGHMKQTCYMMPNRRPNTYLMFVASAPSIGGCPGGALFFGGRLFQKFWRSRLGRLDVVPSDLSR